MDERGGRLTELNVYRAPQLIWRCALDGKLVKAIGRHALAS